ncbi:fumarylacetoacetate hydrolase family protein [Xenophilus azovorans]|uniref:fumarylacetoacetate hydrolase family protein n=1 Tax=Xenophilus azovorans TaxID=151755 RepID=UPI00057044DD|nr:fumarylacetoacetate hydrolase family protein [Xenophilus azovorans]
MKLATLRRPGRRDGELVVVSRDLKRCASAAAVAPHLQRALDDWDVIAPSLQQLYERLNDGAIADAMDLDPAACESPLPRAYQWLDGSAYLNHVELVRKARGAQVPASFYEDPLMYQGGSDSFIGPRGNIVADEPWGIDFEAEVTVVTGDVPLGATPEQAHAAVRLVMLANDVSLRHVLRTEIAKELGFVQSKPATAFTPVAVTPDELGPAWEGARVHLPMMVHLNGKLFGKPHAGEGMTFDFSRLIAHAARTRDIEAGSIFGSGTVSNKQGSLWGSSVENGGVGYCCIAEVRMYETIERGQAQTEFMRHGDTVRIEMFDAGGRSVFGAIENRVVPLP